MTLPAGQSRLQLANTGKRFCLKATDAFGNASGWTALTPGFETRETLTYSFGGVTAVERMGAGAGESHTTYTFSNNVDSATLTVNPNGDSVANIRYLPFGEERWNEVDLPTDRGYTGQRNEGFGLLDYNARYYSAYLGRFISPDSLIPDAYNSMDWDRYAYVRNNPVMNNDPSGHHYCESKYADPSDCEGITFEKIYNVKFTGNWSNSNREAGKEGVKDVARRLAPFVGFTPGEAFNYVFGSVEFKWDPGCPGCRSEGCGDSYSGICTPSGGVTYSSHYIEFASIHWDKTYKKFNVVHELGHAFDNLFPAIRNGINVLLPRYEVKMGIEAKTHPGNRLGYAEPASLWQQNNANVEYEQFADNFLGWVYNTWYTGKNDIEQKAASQRSQFMHTWLPIWLGLR